MFYFLLFIFHFKTVICNSIPNIKSWKRNEFNGRGGNLKRILFFTFIIKNKHLRIEGYYVKGNNDVLGTTW